VSSAESGIVRTEGTILTSPVAGSVLFATEHLEAVTTLPGVTSVEFLLDGDIISADAAAPYEATLDTVPAADGAHELTLIVWTGATSVVVTPVEVTIDNTLTPEARVEEDWRSGRIDLDERVVDLMYADLAPMALPERYAGGPQSIPEPTVPDDVGRDYVAWAASLDVAPSTRAAIGDFIAQPLRGGLYAAAANTGTPSAGITDPCQTSQDMAGHAIHYCSHNSGHFVIHYAPGPTTTQLEVAATPLTGGTPSVVADLAEILESVYGVYTRPTASGGLGMPAPSAPIDVNLTDSPTGGHASGDKLVVTPNASAGRLVYVVAHELFHVFVYLDYQPPEPAPADIGFWNEAVAQWGAHRFLQLNTDHYTDGDDNWALGVAGYLAYPWADVSTEDPATNPPKGYGTSMIAEYLDLRPRGAGETSPVLQSRELIAHDHQSGREAIRTVSTTSIASSIETWLDYARHLYRLDFADPATRAVWTDGLPTDQLAGPRPAGASVSLDAGLTHPSDWADTSIGELGVRYVELVPSSPGVGNVHVAIAAGPTDALGHVAVRVDRFAPDPVNGPTDCTLGSWPGDNGAGVIVDVSQGVGTIDVPVDGSCTYVVLSIVNVGPGEASVLWLATSQPSAILTNGTVQLGVAPLGNLIVPGGTPSAGSGTERVGVRLNATNEEGLAATQQLEGWGIAWSGETSGATGFASVTAADASTPGLALESFSSAGAPMTSQASSRVVAGGMIRVEHEFRPNSYSPYTYSVEVQLTNLGAETVSLTYRRVLDWDVEPTPMNEFVTAGSWCQECNDALMTDNPFVGASPIIPAIGAPSIAPFTDVGPGDRGIAFEQPGLVLEPGDTASFTLFIGAAPDEATGIAALGASRAQDYAIGESSAGSTPARDHTVFLFGVTNHLRPG
jgi:hypothetical protein